MLAHAGAGVGDPDAHVAARLKANAGQTGIAVRELLGAD